VLTPDARFLYAVAEVHRLATGEPADTVKVSWKGDRWAIAYRGEQVGELPDLPGFDDGSALLNSWAARLVAHLALVAALLYGTGMRLLEGLRVRVKDIDFAKNEIVVRGGKGDRDRVTMLPDRLKGPMLKHLAAVRTQHEGDVAKGGGWVELPGALEAKYPNAGRE